MLPIAILPVAGLLLGFGSSFTNETTIATYGLQKILGDGTILHALLIIMNKVGSAVFDNLPLIFAVGVAIGMAKKEKEVAALSALIAYFVMNVAINGMLVVNGKITADGQIMKMNSPEKYLVASALKCATFAESASWAKKIFCPPCTIWPATSIVPPTAVCQNGI